MKRRAPVVSPSLDNDTLTLRLPSAQKRKLQARLALAGHTWSELGRSIAAAYAAGKPILIDGKPVADVLGTGNA